MKNDHDDIYLLDDDELLIIDELPDDEKPDYLRESYSDLLTRIFKNEKERNKK